MSAKIKVAGLPDFDFSEHLDSTQAISEYLNAIVENGDAALLAAALRHHRARLHGTGFQTYGATGRVNE